MIIDPSAPNVENHRQDEIVNFWTSMEDILIIDENNEDPHSRASSVPSSPLKGNGVTNVNVSSTASDSSKVNTCLVNYIKKATDSYKEFINTDNDVYRMALTLTESKIFNDKKKFCIGKLLSLLNIDLLELNMKFIISYILLFEAKKNLYSLEKMLQYQGFTVFYNTLYTQFAYLSKYGEENDIYSKDSILRVQNSTNNNDKNIQNASEATVQFTDMDIVIIDEMKQICTVLMDLLFQIFKYCKCTVANVQLVDDFFVHFLLCTIRSDTLDNMFNNAEFKLLLSLNEQYMMFGREYKLENKVFKYLIDNSISNNFTELLLLKFNRVEDSSLQIMMCKILYLILTSTKDGIAEAFFYLNDLNVFVDVLIRELQDFSEQEEVLRNTFLRVLIPLLKNTELAKTHYRRDDIVSLLQYLSDLDNICSSDVILPEHQVTVKLAFKCLNEVKWLTTNENTDTNAQTTSSRASSITAMAMSFTRSSTTTSFSSVSSSNSNDDYKDAHLNIPTPGTQFYQEGGDVSAESLWKRKNKAVPRPPPSRKSCSSNRNGAMSHMMGIRQNSCDN